MPPERESLLKHNRQRLDTLTSLRFFAAFSIVLFHCQYQFNFLTELFRHGNFSQAVAFFFILSGFVLTFAYQSFESLKQVDLFLFRRFVRIWPLHMATLIITTLVLSVGAVIVPSHPHTRMLADLLTNILMVHSWTLQEKYFFCFNAPSWSISTEWFFYFSLPLIFMFSPPQKQHAILRRGIICMVSLALTISFIFVANKLALPESNANGFSLAGILMANPLVRLYEFSLGSMLAVLFAKCTKSANFWIFSIIELVAVTVLVLVVAGTSNFVNSFGDLFPALGMAGSFWLREIGLVALPFALIIFVFAFEAGLISKFLRLRPLVFLGNLSFSIYLLHFVLVKSYFFYWPNNRSVLDFAVLAIILFLGSFILYKFVELPTRALAEKIIHSEESSKIKAGQITKIDLATSVVSLIAIGSLWAYNYRVPVPTASSFETRDQIARISNKLKLCTIFSSFHGQDYRVNLKWQALESQSLGEYMIVRITDQSGQVNSISALLGQKNQSVQKFDILNQQLILPAYWMKRASKITITIADKKILPFEYGEHRVLKLDITPYLTKFPASTL
ncbi:MAG: acyltransferase [Candidatus Melainabacteria bacterium]|nr:acyltransferase [Candidatus Melainabacteria bacterium]